MPTAEAVSPEDDLARRRSWPSLHRQRAADAGGLCVAILTGISEAGATLPALDATRELEWHSARGFRGTRELEWHSARGLRGTRELEWHSAHGLRGARELEWHSANRLPDPRGTEWHSARGFHELQSGDFPPRHGFQAASRAISRRDMGFWRSVGRFFVARSLSGGLSGDFPPRDGFLTAGRPISRLKVGSPVPVTGFGRTYEASDGSQTRTLPAADSSG